MSRKTTKRSTSRRDTVKQRSGKTMYAKRTARGQVQGDGLEGAAGRWKHSKKTVKSSYGDQGDQKKRRAA